MKHILTNKITRIDNNYIINNETKFKVSSVNEWYNSAYYFNKNTMLNINIKDKLSNFILNSYFNSIPSMLYIKQKRKSRISMKRIFISKSEIKHSSNNIFITIYTFNKQKKFILNTLRKINKMYFRFYEYIKYSNSFRKYLKTSIFIYKYSFKGIILNTFKRKDNKVNLYFYNIFKDIQNSKLHNNIKIKTLINSIITNKFNNIYTYQLYACILYINNLKFYKNNMLGLMNILNKIYNKKVILNIINLKYLFMDNSLLIDGVIRKARDRKKRILRIIRKAIYKSKKCILNSWLLIPDIYKNIRNEDLDLFNNNVISYQNYKVPILETYKYNILSYIFNNNARYIIKNVKYKFLRGIHIQGTGRLTKRLTASRTINKITRKGSLQNIYSTSQHLSTPMLRNDINCNLQYLNINSKNRNGAFGIKSWINSY
jgi:hypothetical protein